MTDSKRKDSDAAYSNFLKSGFLEETMRKNKDKGSTYHRIVKANKKAKKMGLSYGRYMARLWEEKERTPIKKVEKPKKKKEPERMLLTGEEAAEYVRQLKIKAGTLVEESKDDLEEEVAEKSQYSQKNKLAYFNAEWSNVRKKLLPYQERLKNIYFVEEKNDDKNKK